MTRLGCFSSTRPRRNAIIGSEVDSAASFWTGPAPAVAGPRVARPAPAIAPDWCRWQIATASASAASCGLGHAIEPEQQLHHLLDLRLLGAPVADDRALDLGGRVFDDRHAASTAASMATPRACPSFSALRTLVA